MKLIDPNNPVTSAWFVKEGHRLDAPPYLSGGVEARVALDKLRVMKQPLKEVTRGYNGGIFNGPQFKRFYVASSEYGIPFLGSASMLQSDLSNLPFISKKSAFSSKLLPLHVQEGMTLISCSGTIGRMAYARSEMAGMLTSQHVMKIVPNPDVIPPGYLYAYLGSRFGKTLVTSGTYGAIIQHIEPEHIADLQVPRFGAEFESKVHELMTESAKLVSGFYHSLKVATDTFFESVGLTDISSIEWHASGPDYGFENTVSQLSMRALNFNPRFQKLCSKISKVPCISLKDATMPGTLKRGDRFKRIDADSEHAYKLIGQKELFHLEPEGRLISKSVLGTGSLGNPGLIVAAAQGTLGENEVYCRSEFVWSSGVEMAYSEHVVRIQANPEVILPGCLFAFMRSETAFRMLRSISGGSKLQDNHYSFLPELPIPLPEKSVQQKIHDLITDAYEKRWRGVALEQEARSLVEHAIASNFVPHSS